MSAFKKWWNKQNNITLKMADPETIAKAAWNARSYPDEVVELAKEVEKYERYYVDAIKRNDDGDADMYRCYSGDKAFELAKLLLEKEGE